MDDTTVAATLNRMKVGKVPWLVFDEDTKDMQIWHHYDHPLVGVLELVDGTTLLFQLILEEREIEIWKYTILERDFFEKFVRNRLFTSAEAMRAWVREHVDGSTNNVWAVASDLVIATWSD